MTLTPYPISGIVYDIDGTTALSGVIVKLRNITTGEWLPQSAWSTTNSLGEYSIDIANLTGSGYSNNDKLQVTAYTALKSMNFRHTVDTVTGFLNQNMPLHHGGAIFSTAYLISAIAHNASATARTIQLFDRKNDTLILPIRVPANNTVPVYEGEVNGKYFEDGICVIYEDTGTTSINSVAYPSLDCILRVRNGR